MNEPGSSSSSSDKSPEATPVEASPEESPAEASPEAASPTEAEPSVKGALAEGVAAAEAAQASEPEPPTELSETEPVELKLKTPFTLLKGDEELPITPEFLEHKIRYKAGGKEHTRSIDEIVRAAQGSVNTEQLRTQRDDLARELEDLQPQVDQLLAERKVVLDALKDTSGQKWKAIQERFLGQGQGQGEGQGQADPAEPRPSSRDTKIDNDLVQQGKQFLDGHLKPFAERLATTYGADAAEITEAVLEEMVNTPRKFLNADTVAEIMNERIPQALESSGFQPKGEVPRFDPQALSTPTKPRFSKPKASEPVGEPSALSEENAKLKTELAKLKVGSAPPAPGSGATPPAGTADALDLDKAESANDVREALRKLQAS